MNKKCCNCDSNSFDITFKRTGFRHSYITLLKCKKCGWNTSKVEMWNE